MGADLEEWLQHRMDCTWGTDSIRGCSCGLHEAIAKVDDERTSLRLQAGMKAVASGGSRPDSSSEQIANLEAQVRALTAELDAKTRV